jgi:ATP-dependent DNA helicase RecG
MESGSVMAPTKLTLQTEIKYLKQVGPARAEQFGQRGIHTVEDLLYCAPFRYEDRTRVTHIRDLITGQTTTVLGEILTCGLTRTRTGVYIYELAVKDASHTLSGGSTVRSGMLRCKWFNAAYLQRKRVFQAGQRVFLYGKVQNDPFGSGNLQIIQPQFEILEEPRGMQVSEDGLVAQGLPQRAIALPKPSADPFHANEPRSGRPGEGTENNRNLDALPPGEATERGCNGLSSVAQSEPPSLEMGRIVPIYEAISSMGSRVLRRLVWAAISSLDRNIPECLPESVVRRNALLDRAIALRQTHFPDPECRLEDLLRFRTPAQVRLIFEEFFNVAAGLALKRRKQKSAQGVQFRVTEPVRQAIKKILPFHPTSAQKRVLKEIVADMCSPQPMNRLLQGDVGSGKTIVALQAAILAMESGYQVALMAPTEILATQHHLYIKQLLKPLSYETDLLVSARKPNEKAALKKRVAEGSLKLVVGTHALIEEDVEFAKLGLVIVDEQHRFGVLQRYKLIRKGITPDVLVMTATPIPRTLALTLYGDLDFSVIDELPPNRSPVQTRLLTERDRAGAFEFIRQRVKAGEQAYVIYPVIEESAKLDLRPAVRMYEHLSRNVFPELRVGLLHGRLTSEEKEQVMEHFKNGAVQVLVATTVVEVGVDVPNATVMLIEHAERFGLAPLHQLRGRIGRGRGQSACFLLADDPRTEVAEERLRTMVETTDGFKIAEVDLKLRGPGEFFGTRQTGIPAFRVANLIRDHEIMERAKREAFDFVEHPPSEQEFAAHTEALRKTWRRYTLARVG